MLFYTEPADQGSVPAIRAAIFQFAFDIQADIEVRISYLESICASSHGNLWLI